MVVIDTHLARGASNGGFTSHDRGGPYGRTKGAKRVVAVDVTGLPVSETDHEREGPVRHGPWDPAECAALLTEWVERGWVELYLPDHLPDQWELTRAEWETRTELRNGFSILARTDALDLLRDPTRWTVGSADGQASVSKTDIGLVTPMSDWFSQLPQ
jgi:hypothetical protein